MDKIYSDFKTKSLFKYIPGNKYEKDLKTVEEILKTVDISLIPPATGKLREYQLKELEYTKKLLDDIEKIRDLNHLWTTEHC